MSNYRYESHKAGEHHTDIYLVGERFFTGSVMCITIGENGDYHKHSCLFGQWEKRWTEISREQAIEILASAGVLVEYHRHGASHCDIRIALKEEVKPKPEPIESKTVNVNTTYHHLGCFVASGIRVTNEQGCVRVEVIGANGATETITVNTSEDGWRKPTEQELADYCSGDKELLFRFRNHDMEWKDHYTNDHSPELNGFRMLTKAGGCKEFAGFLGGHDGRYWWWDECEIKDVDQS